MEKVNIAADISRNFQNATDILKSNMKKYDTKQSSNVPTNANNKSKKNSDAEFSLKYDEKFSKEKIYSDNHNANVIINNRTNVKNLTKVNVYKTSETSTDYRNKTSAGEEKYTNNQVSNHLDYNQNKVSPSNETMLEKEINFWGRLGFACKIAQPIQPNFGENGLDWLCYLAGTF